MAITQLRKNNLNLNKMHRLQVTYNKQVEVQH